MLAGPNLNQGAVRLGWHPDSMKHSAIERPHRCLLAVQWCALRWRVVQSRLRIALQMPPRSARGWINLPWTAWTPAPHGRGYMLLGHGVVSNTPQRDRAP
jgi:hypothetical protein